MRRISLLLLVLMGCAGSDGDPVEVAERFQARLLDRDDAAAHALLTGTDRTVVPLDAFPDALPRGVALTVFAWGESRLDSASLVRREHDTAAVALKLANGTRDTLRLRATHDPITLWRFELDRVRWRVSLGLAERALLDSLATVMHANADVSDIAGAEQAKAYLRVADRYPAQARLSDRATARSLVRSVAVAEALGIDLRVTESFTGATVIDGRIENPSGARIRTLRLIVRDEAGEEETVELWEIEPGSTTPVRRATRLRPGAVTHRVERIQVF